MVHPVFLSSGNGEYLPLGGIARLSLTEQSRKTDAYLHAVPHWRHVIARGPAQGWSASADPGRAAVDPGGMEEHLNPNIGSSKRETLLKLRRSKFTKTFAAVTVAFLVALSPALCGAQTVSSQQTEPAPVRPAVHSHRPQKLESQRNNARAARLPASSTSELLWPQGHSFRAKSVDVEKPEVRSQELESPGGSKVDLSIMLNMSTAGYKVWSLARPAPQLVRMKFHPNRRSLAIKSSMSMAVAGAVGMAAISAPRSAICAGRVRPSASDITRCRQAVRLRSAPSSNRVACLRFQQGAIQIGEITRI